MTKTLLITTGGTISCTETENGLTPNLKGRDLLCYCKYTCDVFDFKLMFV